MPGAGHAHPPRFRYRALPLWLQWVLPFAVAAIALTALVVWVRAGTGGAQEEAQVSNPKAIVQQNRQADALMRQLQAPHAAKLAPGSAPPVGLKRAITAWLRLQIKSGQIDGPLSGGHCTTTPGSRPARVALRCTIIAGNVSYPFFGVVQPSRGAVTFCQRVTPPIYGMDDFPLSRRCLGAHQPDAPAR